jgi:hypothetical protein
MTVAVYKGDDLLCIGTIGECAKTLSVQPRTIYFYTTAAYKRKLGRRKNSRSARIAEVIPEGDD